MILGVSFDGMIKASELRIGNYICCDSGFYNKPTKVTGMFIRQIDSLNNSEADNYSPIPLTPEILEKCGLLEGNKFRSIEYFNIRDENGYSLYFDDSYLCVDIKYLHQLQNLYYSLCGEELEINL